MNWPPPGSTWAVASSSGRRRDSRSSNHAAASLASTSVGQRPITTRPPLRCSRSMLAKIGAGSKTNRVFGHGITGAIAPFFVLQPRCASRPACGSAPLDLLFAFVRMLSMLGPRESFTDISGSTGSSQSQQRQPSAVPMSSRRLTGIDGVRQGRNASQHRIGQISARKKYFGEEVGFGRWSATPLVVG